MKIVLMVFAGRRVNMEVQMPFLHRILRDYPTARLDLWDLTRDPADAEYVHSLHDPDAGIFVRAELHPGHPIPCGKRASLVPVPLPPSKRPVRRVAPRPVRYTCGCMIHQPPYEQPYRAYADDDVPDDTVYVKIDDDVLFLETDRFDDLIAPLAEAPGAVVSANVINNAVCAKYDPEWANDVEYAPLRESLRLGDPVPAKNDKTWWAAHMSAKFATLSHEWFLEYASALTSYDGPAAYFRTRPGEAISINCIAFTQVTMCRLAAMFDRPERIGDEGAVDLLLPRIATTFHAAHLTFGPQDKTMTSTELDEYRSRYANLAKEYLT